MFCLWHLQFLYNVFEQCPIRKSIKNGTENDFERILQLKFVGGNFKTAKFSNFQKHNVFGYFDGFDTSEGQ